MKQIEFSNKAKRDILRYRNNPAVGHEIQETLDKLSKGESLPANYYVHGLHGVYEGCLECHIRGDVLLIWMDENMIRVVRIGSHHQLFGM